MKLENQVCSLELAKKLKEFGFKQDSLFYWIPDDTERGSYGIWYYSDQGYVTDSQWERKISAFTVTELSLFLKEWNVGFNILKMTRSDERKNIILYEIEIFDEEKDEFFPVEFSGTNEANVRAEILIYLIDSDLLYREVFYKGKMFNT